VGGHDLARAPADVGTEVHAPDLPALRWSSALAVYADPLRWMQQDPAAVRELARTEAPEWGLDEGIVQRWRTGEDVSDDPEVLEFALAWAGGSTRSKAGG
jgi:hypothetical protein